jgi:hypothetical protein
LPVESAPKTEETITTSVETAFAWGSTDAIASLEDVIVPRLLLEYLNWLLEMNWLPGHSARRLLKPPD